MPVTEITSVSALRDIYTTAVTVLSTTPSATEDVQVQVVLKFGDGTNDLEGSGGTITLKTYVGDRLMGGTSRVFAYDAGEVQATFPTDAFTVDAGETLVITAQSDNANDTNVRTIAVLKNVNDGDVTTIEGSDATDQINAACDTAIADAGVTATRMGYVDKLNVSGTLAHSDAAATYKADLTTLEGRLTAARAGYLDKLNVTGALAHSDAAATYKADLTTLEGRLTAARAGYLDNLNVGGLLASAADIAAITQAQRVRVIPPPMAERPDSGSTTYRIWIYAYDATHVAEDLDAAPTVTVENNAGTDRSANLGTVTKPGGTTGQYYVDYTIADDHAIEGLVVKVDATEGGVTTQYAAACLVVDTTAVSFTAADRAMITAAYNKLPSKSYLAGSTDADGGIDATEAAVIAAQLAAQLEAYDGPTNAEMEARTLTAASYATAANQTTMDGKLDSIGAETTVLHNATVLLHTTIAADGRSTTTARLTEGSDQPDAYKGMLAVLDGDEGAGLYVAREILSYDGATREVAWETPLVHDPVSGGAIYIIPADPTLGPAIAAIKTDTASLLTRIPAALFANITSLAQWLGLIAGKQTPDATALSEIRATGAGSGTYDATTDSAEAIRDKINSTDGVIDNVKGVTEKLDTMLETDGEVSRFTENALEQAPTGEGGGGTTLQYILPVSATVAAGEVASDEIVGYQGATLSVAFTILDANGDAVDVSGDAFLFVIGPDEDGNNVVEEITGCTVTTPTNVVRVVTTIPAATDPGTVPYTLWDTTDNTVLGDNRITIKKTSRAA